MDEERVVAQSTSYFESIDISFYPPPPLQVLFFSNYRYGPLYLIFIFAFLFHNPPPPPPPGFNYQNTERTSDPEVWRYFR